MSLSNILHPNDFTLYSGDGTIPGEQIFVIPSQAFTLSGGQTVTSSTVRTVPNPSNLAPPITAILSQSPNGSFVTLCIPSFLITGVSGAGNLTSINVSATLPSYLRPQFQVSEAVPLQTSSGLVIGELAISTVGVIILAPFSGNLGNANPFGGTVGDVYATYIPA